MKTGILLLIISLTGIFALGQVHNNSADYSFKGSINLGKGTTSYTPTNAGAWLEIGASGTTKGLILPRVNDTSSITSPAEGMLIHSLGQNKDYVRTLGIWRELLYASGTGFLLLSDTASMLSPYLHYQAGVKYFDTASMISNLLRKSDTAYMLANLLRKTDTSNMLINRMKLSDTANMLLPYAHVQAVVKYADTSGMLTNYSRNGFSVKYIDTSSMLFNYIRNGFAVKYVDTSSMLSGYARKNFSNVETTANLLIPSGQINTGGLTSAGNISTTSETVSGNLTVSGTINNSNLSASNALITDAGKNIKSSVTTATELGYVSGATSNIQAQITAISSTEYLTKVSSVTLTPVAPFVNLSMTGNGSFGGLTVTGTGQANKFKTNGVASITSSMASGNGEMFATNVGGATLVGSGTSNDVTIINKNNNTYIDFLTGVQDVIFRGNQTVGKSYPQLTLDGTSVANSGAALNILGWTSGQKNWQISTAKSSSGLDFIPSSIIAGNVFTGTPAATLLSNGDLSISGNLTASNGSVAALSGIITNNFTIGGALTSIGLTNASGGVRFDNISAATFLGTGTIAKSPSYGLLMQGATGTAYDAALVTPTASQYIWRVPTGTNNIDFPGVASFSTLSGTLLTAAQPNITSLGTLTSLNVSGTVGAGTLSGATVNANNINVGGGGTTTLIASTPALIYANSSGFAVTDGSGANGFRSNMTTGLLTQLGTSGAVFNGPVILKGYLVSTLPTGVIGATAYVTDALAPSFLVAVVGGGAIVTPVFYNGSNWVAH